MSMQCTICEFNTDNKEKFAGHRSGHVRRGELKKFEKQFKRHVCLVCQREFSTGPALGGHKKKHNLSFDETKSAGTKKNRLIEECGHQCQNCKNTEWMGKPIPLTLDHIDGNTDNSEKINLRLLCSNCHAQTPTFCGKNVGKFPLTHRTNKRAQYYKSSASVSELPSKQ